MPSTPLLNHSRTTCLDAHDLERIVMGTIRAEDVAHLDRCARCRAGLALCAESWALTSYEPAAMLKLAAATIPWQPMQTFATDDGSLTCDLMFGRNEHCALTVVAEQDQWGDWVVLWPGPGEPQLLRVGASVELSTRSFFSFDHWRISPPETAFTAADLLDNRYSSDARFGLSFSERDRAYKLDWATGLSSLLAVCNQRGEWSEAELPWWTTQLPPEFRVFTPLNARTLTR